MPQEHTKRIRNTTVRMGLSGDMAMATKQSTRKRDQIRYEKPALELVCPEKMLRTMLYANVCPQNDAGCARAGGSCICMLHAVTLQYSEKLARHPRFSMLRVLRCVMHRVDAPFRVLPANKEVRERGAAFLPMVLDKEINSHSWRQQASDIKP